MKHIFTVHSPITFLSAISVVKHLELDENDVILLTSGYKVPFTVGNVYPAFSEINASLVQKIRNWDIPKAYDAYINKLTGSSEFIAYVDLMHYWQRILVTHEQCVSFNFIEEGMASYVKPDSLNTLSRIAKTRRFRSDGLKEFKTGLFFALKKYNDRLYNLPYWPFSYRYMENVSYYGFSKAAYPGVRPEKLCVLPFKPASNHNDHFDNVIIWVEESFNKAFVPKQKDIDETIANSIEIVHGKFGKTHSHCIKLRPNMQEERSEVAPLLKEKGIEYEILDNTLPLEPALTNSKNVVLIGAISSLLYYGSIMGHEAYSYFWDLKNKKENIFPTLEYYWDKVKLIS